MTKIYWNKACSCMHQVIISVMVLALLDSRRIETSETVQWTCKIRCMSQAGAAAYAASCAQDFPDASELIEELFERWDRRRDHGDPRKRFCISGVSGFS